MGKKQSFAGSDCRNQTKEEMHTEQVKNVHGAAFCNWNLKKEKPLKRLLERLCGISTQAESELTYKFYIWS